MQMSDDPCPGEWGESLELGDGSIYCSAENWNYRDNFAIEQIETAENHFKITYDGWTSEHRWEYSDHKPGLVIIGDMYDDGYYYCNFYFAENELPDNFGVNDLSLGDESYYLYPSWCDSYSADSEGIDYSLDEPHPFLGVKMYNSMYYGYSEDLIFEITTNSSMDRINYISSEFVQIVIEEEIIIGTLLIFVALFIMLKIDRRRPVLKFDIQGKRMSMRRSMTSTRWGGWSWKNINYSSATLVVERDCLALKLNINGVQRLVARFDGEGADDCLEPLKELLEIADKRIIQSDRRNQFPPTVSETAQLDPDFETPEAVVNETRIVEYQEGVTAKEESVHEPTESVQLDAFWTSKDSEDN